MQWSDVTTKPSQKTLRQFAGLWLVFFGAIAAWRAWHGDVATATRAIALLAVVIGGLGLALPAATRWIYTGWMIAAFPIGWTISRLIVAALFFLVFTPVALVFRLMRRDALSLRRGQSGSYWTAKPGATGVTDYFRQF